MKQTVKSNGVEYMVELSMYSMKLYQKEKGVKVSEIGDLLNSAETEMDVFIIMAQICYYGAMDVLQCKGEEIAVNEAEFVRGIKLSESAKLSDLVLDFIGAGEPEKTEVNTRQTKKKAAQVSE